MQDPLPSPRMPLARENRIHLVNTEDHAGPLIKVIGVGGAGGNAVDNMIEEHILGVEFITANTDWQALEATLAPTKLQIGTELTEGLGAGANPEIGRRSAEEGYQDIRSHLIGTDMLFITAGMGGGTGTGAAPVIARIAKELGCLTVAVITKPFGFEGKMRQTQAESGLRALRKVVDSLITVPNERVLQVVDRGTSLRDAFKMVDNVLRQAVESISNLIVCSGLINLDFADVQTVMSGAGQAVMGTGVGHGRNRAIEATRLALSSPFLEDSSIDGARGILLNVTGGSDVSLHEVQDAASIIRQAAHEDAHIIFGAVTDDKFEDQLCVTVIAAGFGSRELDERMPRPEEGGTREVENLHRGQEQRRRFHMAAKNVSPHDKSDERHLNVPAFTRRK